LYFIIERGSRVWHFTTTVRARKNSDAPAMADVFTIEHSGAGGRDPESSWQFLLTGHATTPTDEVRA
jgi:hypothetical protein